MNLVITAADHTLKLAFDEGFASYLHEVPGGRFYSVKNYRGEEK